MTAIKTLYRCGECSEVHDDEDEAQECCMPAVVEVFQCPACDEIHYAHDAAAKCCDAGELVRCPCCARDYAPRQIGYHAIRTAGHCQTCNPLFSVDQQVTIEDSLIAITGEPVSVQRGDA